MLQIKMLMCRQRSCCCVLSDQPVSLRDNSGQGWIVQVRGAMINVSVYYKPSVWSLLYFYSVHVVPLTMVSLDILGGTFLIFSSTAL